MVAARRTLVECFCHSSGCDFSCFRSVAMYARSCRDHCAIGLQPAFASQFISTFAPPVHYVTGAAFFFHVPVAIQNDLLLFPSTSVQYGQAPSSYSYSYPYSPKLTLNDLIVVNQGLMYDLARVCCHLMTSGVDIIVGYAESYPSCRRSSRISPFLSTLGDMGCL